MKKLKFYLLLIVLLPMSTFAWNGQGHMTGGAIAYYYLKAHNPAALAKALNTLKQHPWYKLPIWQSRLKGLTAEQQSVTLFMLASVFPDEARDTARLGGYPMTEWHFYDFGFVAPGAKLTAAPAPSPNALQKITQFSGTIPSAKEDSTKAYQLCWVMHLIEDIHQPLHSATLFDTASPKGDRGGNDTFFKIGTTGKVTKLHSYWDGLIPGNITTIPVNARVLLAKPIYKETSLTELTADPAASDWILKESAPLAKRVAYNNLPITGTATAPTVETAAYASLAQTTAEKRIVLAGIRLAKVLAKFYS